MSTLVDEAAEATEPCRVAASDEVSADGAEALQAADVVHLRVDLAVDDEVDARTQVGRHTVHEIRVEEHTVSRVGEVDLVVELLKLKRTLLDSTRIVRIRIVEEGRRTIVRHTAALGVDQEEEVHSAGIDTALGSLDTTVVADRLALDDLELTSALAAREIAKDLLDLVGVGDEVLETRELVRTFLEVDGQQRNVAREVLLH